MLYAGFSSELDPDGDHGVGGPGGAVKVGVGIWLVAGRGGGGGTRDVGVTA